MPSPRFGPSGAAVAQSFQHSTLDGTKRQSFGRSANFSSVFAEGQSGYRGRLLVREDAGGTDDGGVVLGAAEVGATLGAAEVGAVLGAAGWVAAGVGGP